MKIANILTTKGRSVLTVRPAQTLRAAVTLLAGQSVGALVVVDEDRRPIGIVTERHIVRSLAADDKALTRPVGEIMSWDLVTAAPDDELASVLHVMAQRRIRHVPVVEAGQLIGIVSLGDVIRIQRDRYRGEAETLETRVMASRQ